MGERSRRIRIKDLNKYSDSINSRSRWKVWGKTVAEVFPLRLETTLKLLFIAANFEGEWLDARKLYVHFARIKRSFFVMNFFPVWSMEENNLFVYVTSIDKHYDVIRLK